MNRVITIIVVLVLIYVLVFHLWTPKFIGCTSTVPSRVNNIRIKNINLNRNTITFSWDKVSDAAGYKVFVTTNLEISVFETINNMIELTLNKIMPNIISVKAINNCAESEPSEDLKI